MNTDLQDLHLRESPRGLFLVAVFVMPAASYKPPSSIRQLLMTYLVELSKKIRNRDEGASMPLPTVSRSILSVQAQSQTASHPECTSQNAGTTYRMAVRMDLHQPD